MTAQQFNFKIILYIRKKKDSVRNEKKNKFLCLFNEVASAIFKDKIQFEFFFL